MLHLLDVLHRYHPLLPLACHLDLVLRLYAEEVLLVKALVSHETNSHICQDVVSDLKTHQTETHCLSSLEDHLSCVHLVETVLLHDSSLETYVHLLKPAKLLSLRHQVVRELLDDLILPRDLVDQLGIVVP